MELSAKLGRAWNDEDEAACLPVSSSADAPTTGGGRSAPTERRALGPDLGDDDPKMSDRALAPTDDQKYRQRDHVGDQLMHVHAMLKKAVEDRQPRRPSGPCNCCRNETATHGGLCLACHDFLRARKFPCDARIHEERGGVRWCQCDGGCCPDGCDDRAAEGRMVSERCKARQARRAA